MLRVGLLIAGVLLFIWLIIELDPGQIFSLLSQLGAGILLVCAVYTGYVSLRATALHMCIIDSERPGYPETLALYVSGEAVKNLTFGGALFSEPFKAILLKRSGVEAAGAYAAPITESLSHITFSSGFALMGLVYLVIGVEIDEGLEAGIIVTILGLLLFLLSIILIGWYQLHWVSRLTGAFAGLSWVPTSLKPDASHVYEVEKLFLSIASRQPRRFAGILAVELLAQCILVFELYVILILLDLSFPLSYPLLIEAVAKVTRVAFFFVPLQLGAAEGVFSVLFDSFGLPAAAGFTFSVVRRLRSLVTSGFGLVAGWYFTR